MAILSVALVALATTLPSHALPTQNINASGTDCSKFPSYDPNTSIAGPWSIVAASTGTTIDGAAASYATFTNDGKDQFGFVTVPQAGPNFGTTPHMSMRCASSTLQASISAGAHSNATWVPVTIAADENWQHGLSFGLGEGIPVQAYERPGNGTTGSGVYLGAQGATKWAFKHNWGGNAGDYFLLRWLEEGTVDGTKGKRQAGTEPPIVDDRDWVGYLKIAV